MIVLYLCLIYGSSLAFNYIATSFFIRKWFNGVATAEAISVAGEAMGLPFLIAALLIPIFGFIVDKFQNRANLLLAASTISFLAFFNFIYFSSALGLLFFGTSFSLALSIVGPSIALIVPSNYLSIALSLNLSVSCFATSTFPLIISFIHSNSKNFSITLKFFLITTGIASIIAIFIIREDKVSGYKLNGSPDNEIKQINKSFAIEEENDFIILENKTIK